MISFIEIAGIKYLDPSPFLQMAPGKDGDSEADNENHRAIAHFICTQYLCQPSMTQGRVTYHSDL